MLVTCSGIDGAGKTALAHRLADELRRLGFDAEYLRPRYLCNDIVKRFCAVRFGDPNRHVPNIHPDTYIGAILLDWLDLAHQRLADHGGAILVCDRYLPDVIAQAIHYRAAVAPVVAMAALLPRPDASFLLDVPPAIAHQRLVRRSDPPIHHLESLENLEILSGAFREVPRYLDWEPIVLGADIDIPAVLHTVLAIAAPTRRRHSH